MERTERTLNGKIYITSSEKIVMDGEFMGTKSWLFDLKNNTLRRPNEATATFGNMYCEKIIQSNDKRLNLPYPKYNTPAKLNSLYRVLSFCLPGRVVKRLF
jgi:hypothetical protein